MKKTLFIIFFSFTGGLWSTWLLSPTEPYAKVQNAHYKTIQLHNFKGNKVGYLGAHDSGNEDGQGIMFLYDGEKIN